jgi:hypothetical protein
MSQRFEYEPSILADPQFVTAHEAGHALLAYYHGLQIGRIRFFLHDGQFAGAYRPIEEVEIDADARAERLLAGDLAARLLAGIRTDRVSLPIENAGWIGRWTSSKHLCSLLQQAGSENRQGEAKHDVLKVMDLVTKHRSDRILWARRWWGWFWERVDLTYGVLDSEPGRLAHHALADFYLKCAQKSDMPISGELSRQVLESAGAPLRGRRGM